MQAVANAVLRRAYLAADIIELVRRGIVQISVAVKGTGNLVFKCFICRERVEIIIERILLAVAVFRQRAGGGEHTADLQNLAHGEHRALFRAVDGGGNIGHGAEWRHPFHGLHRVRRFRFLLHFQNSTAAFRRHERERRRACALCRCAFGEHGAYFIKFKRPYRFFEAFHKFSLSVVYIHGRKFRKLALSFRLVLEYIKFKTAAAVCIGDNALFAAEHIACFERRCLFAVGTATRHIIVLFAHGNHLGEYFFIV